MARRVPVPARIFPGTRRRLRQLRLDTAAFGLGRPKPPPLHGGKVTYLLADADRGNTILTQGFLRFGQEHTSSPEKTWLDALPSQRFADFLHGFEWLYDLSAVGSEASRERARDLVGSWIAEYGGYHSFAWKPSILATRVLAWATMAPDLAHADDAAPGEVFRSSLLRQARYLSRILDKVPDGPDRFAALLAVAATGLRARDADALVTKAMTRLPDLLARHILPDGGHVSRSPEAALESYARLKMLDDLLEARGRPAVPALSRALDRIVPMIATLSHSDRGLAAFHGGGEGHGAALDGLLAKAEAKPFAFAPSSGYQRATRGDTVLILDVGEPAPFPFDASAHLSPLAFEMSTRAGRWVVNCGYSTEQPLDWHQPVRQLPAHSALDLQPASPVKWLPAPDVFAGHAATLPDAMHIAKGPAPVRATRREAEPGILLEGSHEGFAASAGLLHHRRLFLADSGDDIRVEDRLAPAPGGVEELAQSQTVTIRLHLHPDVEARMSEKRTHVELALGDERWAFLASAEGFAFALEPSAYLASGARPRETSQIVIRGTTSKPETVLRWGLRKR